MSQIPESSDDMRPEYDFSKGVRGKHYKAYQKDSNVVLLDPDVAEVFKNSESVNQALRLINKTVTAKIVTKSGKPMVKQTLCMMRRLLSL